MKTEKRDFDAAAASWDEKPQRVKLARDIGEAMIRAVKFTSDMDVLDFGCGTGLLTFHLQPHVRSIIGADSSRGMLEIFNGKIAASPFKNICSMYYDVEQGHGLVGSYDCIVSAMTLHHLPEIEPLLSRFHAALIPGGMLCLADLDLDGGRFHEDDTGVFHPGFDRSELTARLLAAGFVDVRDQRAAEIVKPTAGGASERFSVFLLTCKKD